MTLRLLPAALTSRDRVGPVYFVGERDSIPILAHEFAEEGFASSFTVDIRRVDEIAARFSETLVDESALRLIDAPILGSEGHGSERQL